MNVSLEGWMSLELLDRRPRGRLTRRFMDVEKEDVNLVGGLVGGEKKTPVLFLTEKITYEHPTTSATKMLTIDLWV